MPELSEVSSGLPSRITLGERLPVREGMSMRATRAARCLQTLLVLGLLTTGMMALVSPSLPAYAEAKIVQTVPSDHETVPSPPDHISLTFDEPIDGATAVIAVSVPGGGRVEIGKPQVKGYDIVQKIRLIELRGDVTVGYRVHFADGAVLTGAFAYAVASVGATAPPTEPASVIASALAQVDGNRGDDAADAPGAPGASRPDAAGADIEPDAAWYRRPWVAAAGAVALLVVAGLVVVSPQRSGRRG